MECLKLVDFNFSSFVHIIDFIEIKQMQVIKITKKRKFVSIPLTQICIFIPCSEVEFIVCEAELK